jgi:aminoglycoside phosphotransferase (APT) family kinase protein
MTGSESCLRVDRFLLPAGDGGVLRQFLDRHFVAHSARERVGALAARGSLGLRAPGAARLLLPGADASVRDGFEAGVPIRRALRQWGLDPEGRWIQLLDYPGGRGGSVTFVFPEDGRHPPLVVKVRPRAGDGPPLRREWEALVDVRRRLPGDLRASVPEPLAFEREGDMEILALSLLPGRSPYLDMQNLLLPTRRAVAHLDAASRWLACFHDATVDGEPRGDPIQELPDRVVLMDRVRKAHGSAPDTMDPDLRWYDGLRETLVRTPVPRSAVHGDFWARNLLMGPGPLPGVVDWERYRPNGSPAADLFHFPLTYGLNHPWRRYRRLAPLEAFERTFLLPNAVSRGVQLYLLRYARIRGMGLDLLRGLFLLHLLGMGGGLLKGNGVPPAWAPPEGGPWINAYARFLASPRSVFSP